MYITVRSCCVLENTVNLALEAGCSQYPISDPSMFILKVSFFKAPYTGVVFYPILWQGGKRTAKQPKRETTPSLEENWRENHFPTDVALVYPMI